MDRLSLLLRPAVAGDLPRFEEIRAAAFAPVFASFRRILGDRVYELAQRHEDEAQGGMLASLLADDSADLYAVEVDEAVVGFCAVHLDHDRKVGEIGLNAIDPRQGGGGLGTAMYEAAIARMKDAGMKVAHVATGGDPSHAPARRAYRKAGFDLEMPSVWFVRHLEDDGDSDG